MLTLPVNLLIADQAGVDRYLARIADPNADEFDFGGLDVLEKVAAAQQWWMRLLRSRGHSGAPSCKAW